VYFGTFNPVHYGHLQIAQGVLNQGLAKQVAFVPTGNPPNRAEDPSLVAGHHRFEMLRRVTAQHPHFTVWPDEIDFPNPNGPGSTKDEPRKIHYTSDTLESRFQLSSRPTPLNIPFILGEDSFNTLSSWKNIDCLIFHCHFLLIRRHGPGSGASISEPLPGCRYTVLDLPLLPYSATDIRQRFSKGTAPHFLTPQAVIEYAEWNQLYD
jgi:nicotinate-nucleotide adenylyltransferase